MSIPILDENSVEELDLPGRKLRWVITQENSGAQYCTMAVIRVAPGQRVRPHTRTQMERRLSIFLMVTVVYCWMVK